MYISRIKNSLALISSQNIYGTHFNNEPDVPGYKKFESPSYGHKEESVQSAETSEQTDPL